VTLNQQAIIDFSMEVYNCSSSPTSIDVGVSQILADNDNFPRNYFISRGYGFFLMVNRCIRTGSKLLTHFFK
jgi:hypothetical protein